eukprot:5343373-Prymnesium_polylepis.2
MVLNAPPPPSQPLPQSCLWIYTAGGSYDDSGGQLTIKLVDANGNSKGGSTRAVPGHRRPMTWTPPNGVQWAVGDAIRLTWGSTDAGGESAPWR